MENTIKNIYKCKATDRVSNHDLVFKSPVSDPLYGIPIGDGSTGSLIYPEKNSLVISLNNTDLWDIKNKDEIHSWDKKEEENYSSLKGAGKVEIRFDAPVFDVIYQKNYEARLSLEEALFSLNSETNFSKISVKAFASNEFKTTVVKIKNEFDDENRTEINLENYGSRTFGHWYAQIKRDASIGLDKTQSILENDIMCVTRMLTDKAFCTAIKVVASPYQLEQSNRFSLKYVTAKEKKQEILIFITVETGENEEIAKNKAIKNLEKAVNTGFNEMFSQHSNEWKSFWNKSYVNLTDDYIENIWYLNSYYANCEMRGNYPPHFCNGIWGFNHDYVPWNYYYHWNMQLQYWSHFSSGHTELLKTYLDFRYNQLEGAEKVAKSQRGVEGALYTDVSSASGACDVNSANNLTPGAQISLNFWYYYLYTNDIEYFCEKGFPVIYKSALLYKNLVVFCNDGYYHLYKSQAYEGSPMMDDVITDTSAMNMVFDLALKSMDLLSRYGKLDKFMDKREEFKKIIDKLYPIQLVEMENDEYEIIDGEKRIKSGVGKGRLINKNLVPITGIYRAEERGEEGEYEDRTYWDKVKKGTKIRSTFSSSNLKHYYGFPNPEYSAVVPNNCVGLKDKNSDLFEAMSNLMYMKEAFVFKDNEQLSYIGEDSIPYTGWSLDPIILARLGLSEDLYERLNSAIKAWQWFPNGLGAYDSYENLSREANMRFFHRTVKDCDDDTKKFQFPSWEFRHFDFEMMPIAADAVNEALLQSFENRIRLFPSVRKNFTGSFKLYTQSFVSVEAKMENGITEYAIINALWDTSIMLVNPFLNKRIAVYKLYENKISDPVYYDSYKDANDYVSVINLKKGDEIIITDEKTDIKTISTIDIKKEKNNSPKHKGRAVLGIEQMY